MKLLLNSTGKYIALGTCVLALGLTGCSGENSAEFSDAETVASHSESTPTSDSASEQNELTEESASADETDGSRQSLSEQFNADTAMDILTYDVPSDDVDATMTVGFHSLVRKDKTMELTLSFTPDFTGNETYTLFDLHGNHALIEPVIFDRENFKGYKVLAKDGTFDTPERWSSPNGEVELASGETQVYTATFPAPEDNVETVAVSIGGLAEFSDVEIQDDAETQEG